MYGAYEPTCIFVPFNHFKTQKKYELITTELFGPFSIISEFDDKNEMQMLKYLEDLSHHLTAAIVSNDVHFTNRVLAHTINGTTYHGLRARTTGAPQNHWFGPSGDPRGAGIGTDEAIQLVWSHHREIITDVGPVVESWSNKGPI